MKQWREDGKEPMPPAAGKSGWVSESVFWIDFINAGLLAMAGVHYLFKGDEPLAWLLCSVSMLFFEKAICRLEREAGRRNAEHAEG